ncbi:hypothetical protein M422DRAFT_271554 [Sphaerobolus stellatus SS14]|uniref:Uncharacterized protein n=1 Tax=Sphaerobolus stellatus (strain SS14) TaxID=990650 RepID=A0A0C9UPC8_SPHS4|nr:hypothetical protein M422DRAFT_271554 [Sphaerobolus stellatus SS14]
MDELVDVTRAASGSRAGLPLLNVNASYTVHRVAAPFPRTSSSSWNTSHPSPTTGCPTNALNECLHAIYSISFVLQASPPIAHIRLPTVNTPTRPSAVMRPHHRSKHSDVYVSTLTRRLRPGITPCYLRAASTSSCNIPPPFPAAIAAACSTNVPNPLQCVSRLLMAHRHDVLTGPPAYTSTASLRTSKPNNSTRSPRNSALSSAVALLLVNCPITHQGTASSSSTPYTPRKNASTSSARTIISTLRSLKQVILSILSYPISSFSISPSPSTLPPQDRALAAPHQHNEPAPARRRLRPRTRARAFYLVSAFGLGSSTSNSSIGMAMGIGGAVGGGTMGGEEVGGDVYIRTSHEQRRPDPPRARRAAHHPQESVASRRVFLSLMFHLFDTCLNGVASFHLILLSSSFVDSITAPWPKMFVTNSMEGRLGDTVGDCRSFADEAMLAAIYQGIYAAPQAPQQQDTNNNNVGGSGNVHNATGARRGYPNTNVNANGNGAGGGGYQSQIQSPEGVAVGGIGGLGRMSMSGGYGISVEPLLHTLQGLGVGARYATQPTPGTRSATIQLESLRPLLAAYTNSNNANANSDATSNGTTTNNGINTNSHPHNIQS